MDIIDSKYIGLVSSRLQKFKRVKPNLYNFRCPVCGDSRKHKNKARGYFYQVKTNTNFKCHNCGASSSFNNFLKQIDVTLHKQYVMEKFKEGHSSISGIGNFVVDQPKFEFKKPVFRQKLDIPRASEVPVAKDYLKRRGLDPTKFFFAAKFKEWVNTQKYTFHNIVRDESRIIIPMYDEDQNIIGFQGRSLGPNNVKYITVMLDDNAPKIYGLDKIDKQKPIYILEGPFDSTFVENAVAMCGSDIDIRTFGWSNYIWVFDNEPRNREIINRISKVIDRGDKVVIWPRNIIEKDVNDMINSGQNITQVIESNVYSGLQAKIKFNNWKKV
jgi:transcription elongation factor Elf1|tara:strand:+ start:589 stop:1572 length:984 start_codon:yes stop_codon:yes gene_type:complete